MGHDMDALFCERDGDGTAYAPSGACYQGDLAL
jgi:hypothetical protein